MFGETFRRARKGKGMTLKEACGDALSVSQLSRFENGKSVIPVDLFYDVLSNINTTSEEFYYFMGQKTEVELSRQFDLIAEYVREQQYDALKQLKQSLKESYPNPYSWEQFLIYFISSLLDMNEDKEPEAHHFILDYLMQVENWGEMELRLYALFGFVLEVETMHHLMHTALKRSMLYQHIPQDQKLLHIILSNTFSTFLFRDRLDYAEETIELFEEVYSENVDFVTPHIDFMFNRGLLYFKKGEVNQGKECCEKAINFCKLFKQKKSEQLFKKRYRSWLDGLSASDYKELTINVNFFSYTESKDKD